MKRFFSTMCEKNAKKIIKIDEKFEENYRKMLELAKRKIENNPKYAELIKNTNSKKLDESLEKINEDFKNFSAY